jgi:DNA polymerase delta subunit 1
LTSGESQPFIRNVFTLNTCSNIVGSQVLTHNEEDAMLLAWSEFVQEVDPDIITGYNISNFDFPYLLDRADALKLDKKFYNLGRLKGEFM